MAHFIVVGARCCTWHTYLHIVMCSNLVKCCKRNETFTKSPLSEKSLIHSRCLMCLLSTLPDPCQWRDGWHIEKFSGWWWWGHGFLSETVTPPARLNQLQIAQFLIHILLGHYSVCCRAAASATKYHPLPMTIYYVVSQQS